MRCYFRGFRAQVFNQLVQTPTGYLFQVICVGICLGICFLGFEIKKIRVFTRLTWVHCNHRGTGGVMTQGLTYCRQLAGAFSIRPPGPHTLQLS